MKEISLCSRYLSKPHDGDDINKSGEGSGGSGLRAYGDGDGDGDGF